MQTKYLLLVIRHHLLVITSVVGSSALVWGGGCSLHTHSATRLAEASGDWRAGPVRWRRRWRKLLPLPWKALGHLALSSQDSPSQGIRGHSHPSHTQAQACQQLPTLPSPSATLGTPCVCSLFGKEPF